MMAMILRIIILLNKTPKCYKIQIRLFSDKKITMNISLQYFCRYYFQSLKYKKSKFLTLFISSSYSFFSSPSAAITCFGAIKATKQLLS